MWFINVYWGFMLAGCLARKIYVAKRETAAAIIIQKCIRSWLLRHAFLELHAATITIQSSIRGFSTRKMFLHGKEHKAATLIQVNLIQS